MSQRNNSGYCSSCSVKTPGVKQGNGALPSWESGPKHAKKELNYLLNGLHLKNLMENADVSGNVAFRNLKASTLSILKVAGDWLERNRPLFARVTTNMYNACYYVKLKVEQAYPVVLKWLIHFGNIMLLLSMIWLDCTLKRFLIVMAIAAFVGVFIGLTLGLLVVAISGTVFLWLYGSFWTTIFFIIIGGLAFMLSHERLALLTTTVYSVYCAWIYVGWFGFILALHLSFISRLSSDRSPGVPSTSGADSELTSEEEVFWLLNCTDHYSVLDLSRYENLDVYLLKREYRKKVLLDSLKRKAYDDELRREELLNYFCRFQNTSQKNGERGFFASGFAHSEAEGDDPFGESRLIACKKCNNFHIWIHTKKSKSRARWCQDCKDFHQAKYGDGWVEQSSQPFFFGSLQKVDAPTAYVCVDSKIYNATEWYICEGMRCPANTHKPSFHVNTSVTSKGSSSGQSSGRMPASNMEETMTEEEFF
ncbi:hypothetical protein GH714_039728 [Hevea brasiliensis]|uniref:Cleavage inducing molecular chaperone Jiv domain-containing protein n=1 Tax=Hevea brasiliensis TaxID=3981 RepID=A0A6A6MG14_HEVBR|nr:hypothetical protein GH714_039728 [Hevea brasiliensis]